MNGKSIAIVLAVLAIIAGTSAQAVVVTVTPIDGNLCTNGWSVEAYNLGTAAICPWGPSSYDGAGSAFMSGGRGAFYATCDQTKGTAPAQTGDKSPSTAWLGLETWEGQTIGGQTLGSITTLDYYSYVANSPQRYGDGGVVFTEPETWTKTSYWRYVNQPIILEFTVENAEQTERRQLWYRAWGGNYTGDDLPLAHLNQWEHLDCMTRGKWYMPQTGISPNTIERGWASWTEMINFQLPDGPMPPFSDWKLVETDLGWKSPGWNGNTTPPGSPNSNGTGKAINFHVGARITSVNPLWLQGGAINWVNGTYGFRGQVDRFTLGLNGVNVTYDFEPAPGTPPEHVVVAPQKSMVAPMMFQGNTKNMNLFKIAGRVTRVHDGVDKNDYFVIDDGSNLTYEEKWKDPLSGLFVTETRNGAFWIFLDPNEAGAVREGDYVSAYGFPEKMRIRQSDTPTILWTSPDKVYNMSWP